MSDSEHSDASVTWEDFFGTSTDLVPTLLGMYDAALRETTSGSQTSKQHKRRSIISLQQSSSSSRPTSPSLLKQCLTTNVSKTEKRQSFTTLPGDAATLCNAGNSNGANLISKHCSSSLHGNIKKQLNIASRTQSTCSINSYVFTPNVKRILSNLEDDVTVSSPCLSPTSCDSRNVDYCKSSKDTTCFMSCVKKCECSKSSEDSCSKSHEHRRTNTCEDGDKCTSSLKKVDLLQSEFTNISTDEILSDVKVSDQTSKNEYNQSGLNESLQNKSSLHDKNDQNSKTKSPQNGRPLTFTDGLRNCFLYRYNSTLRNKLTSPILSRKVPKTNIVDNNSRVPINTANGEKTNHDSNVTASEDIPTAKDNKSTVSFQQSKVRNVPTIPKIELESKSSQSPESSANDDLDGGTTASTGPGSSVLLQVPRPLSMSSIASSTSTSSASSGGVANKGGVNAYLASIESLDDDSDCDNDLRHVNRTLARVKECEKESGSQGSGDTGIMVSVPICVYPKPARYCDPQLSPVERVLMEIVDTEAIYVDDLHQVIQGYLDHWKQDEECLLQEHLPDLFSNIEEIYSFNSKFLDQLQQCGLNAVNISRTFVQNNDGFEIYTQYCTNYPKTMSVLTRLMSSDMTAKMFRDLQSRLGHSLPLGSYLLKPVQRILKYHLLLQNLMKQCGNEDVSDIELALLTMTGIAQHINNMKRKHEHEVRVQEIQSLLYGWDGEDLTTFGELCAEGTFRMHGAKAQRHAFLFDKMLLLTKNKEDGILSYKAHIMCSNLMLIESVPGEPLSFHVIPFDNPRMQCTLQARNLEQKREWTLQLKRVILENYNAVIPNHARQLVMQLGQNRTDDEVLAEKSISGKKQHSAPEYLQRRKIDRERRKSETGLRYKLRKSRKSDVSPSIDANDADELPDGGETSSPISVTRRSLTRNCSENRERSKSRDTFVKFGSWRRKSEPGAEVNYFSSNEQSNDSKSSTLERFLSPERQPDFKISQYNTKTVPKKITKLKKARNKHRSAKFYTDLDISSACDEVLHISESNDSLEAVENREIEDKVVAVSECTDNDAKDCNSNKDTDIENNTETIENIVSQLLMQNREFQKILKKQKKHINLRNRLNKTPTFESSKNKEIDNASDVEINIENANGEEGENIYEALLNNADNGKFTDLTKEQNAKFDESDYVTLSYKSQPLILDNTHKDKNEILSLENMNRNNKIQERVLQNKLNDSRKSPVKLNLKDDPSLPNSEKAAKKLDEENTSAETQESRVNYENLNDVRKKIDLSSNDSETMSEGVCPNTAEIWLKQQCEHMATPSTKKAGSLPRSFELNEYFPFEKCSKYLSRDGKPLNSDRPLTVASDNLADIDFTDIKNFFLEMSNEYYSETKDENTGEVQVEIENTKEEPIYDVPINKPVSNEKSELPSINIHPDYKIYRPSINISAVKSVLAKANKKPSKPDETNSAEDLTKDKKQTATIVRHYSRSLLQRFKNIINEEIQNSSEFSESINDLNQTNETNLSENQKENDVNQIYDVPRKIVTDRSSDVKEEGIRYGCVSSSNPKINDPCYNLNTSILNSESAWPAIRVSPCKDLPTYKQGSESLGARIAQSDYANPRELFVNVKPENILINTYSLRPDSLLSNSSHFTSSSDEYQDEEHNKTKTDRNSNSDCYYETTAERLLENDVFRDSAVYSDHDDGVTNKDKILTEAINPATKIVRHESVSKLKSQRNHILVEKTQSRIVKNVQIHETVEQSSAEISDVKNGNSLQNPLKKRQIKRPTKLPPPIPVKPELKLCKTETVHITKVETVNDIRSKRSETEHSNVQLTRNEQTSLKKESVKVEINKSVVQRRKELEEFSNTSKSSRVSVMKEPVGDLTSRNLNQKVMEIEKSSGIKKDSRIPVGKYSIDKKRTDFDEKCLKRQMFNSDINENKTESSSEDTVAKEMLSSPHSKGWVKHVVDKFQ